jgi:hypothetical protein
MMANTDKDPAGVPTQLSGLPCFSGPRWSARGDGRTVTFDHFHQHGVTDYVGAELRKWNVRTT